MATTTEFIAATSDGDLLRRAIAAAQIAGVANAQAWVEANFGKIIAQTVSPAGDPVQTVADVYAYALNVRNQAVAALPVPPGQNLGAVTDANLATAIASAQV